ncbi:MAG: nickel-responsive transcriptional regulator NikR [Candidatus Thermoplasmatota archaeon]|nr:nickel-responsive transcriptional regulator NikR [Candidatus Thermoplasmatota archaeon]
MAPSSKVMRTGISVPQDLLQELDGFVRSTSYSNRSEAIRDAVRALLHEHKGLMLGKGDRFGAVMALFDLHEKGASDLLHMVQHEYSDVVNSVTHVHLVDLRNCLELLIVRGKAERVNELINHMVGSKGVKEIKSIML